MSRAFVKDAEDKVDDLPDRPLSPHRNLVTKEGLAAIEVALGRFEAAHRAAIDKSDTQAAAVAQREIRYWRARRASAEVITPSTDKSRASFGMTVLFAGLTAESKPSGSLARMRPIRLAAQSPMSARLRGPSSLTRPGRQSKLPGRKPSYWRYDRAQPVCLVELTTKENRHAECLRGGSSQGPPRGKRDRRLRCGRPRGHVLATFKTQKEAIAWAKKNNHSPLVARVRHSE
jgi:transcription elongation GreA/GreB family factor